jgi:4-hydroxy-tetrahydrodipicolinate synthase
MNNFFPDGVWPVMLTPFTEDNKVDYTALEALIEWYINGNVDGLFAVCQSSEMFYLKEEEKYKLASFIKAKSGNRLPVIASGIVSDNIQGQIEEVRKMADTGVDAIILVTNRFANQDENDDILKKNVYQLLENTPNDILLGFYECPYPYKRLLSLDLIKEFAETNRFYFLKDTSCDTDIIKKRLEVTKNTNMKIYNANTATLLETLKLGIAGYSGVMANFHPELYSWLFRNFSIEPEKAADLQNFLSIAALIERQNYPINAKYYLQLEGIRLTTKTRTNNGCSITKLEKLEVSHLFSLTKEYRKKYFEGQTNH